MILSTHPGLPRGKFLWIAGVALLLLFLILGFIGGHDGIGSLDAVGIIRVVDLRLQTGKIDVSRPPGHPLNEYWVLPNLVRLLGGGGTSDALSPSAYAHYQLVGGLICLGLFWFLLGEFSLSPTRRLLATACLAFSPQVLITSSDGEEFLWGMGCIFAMILVIAKLSANQIRQPVIGWGGAVALAVAASGYRIEYGAVAFLLVFGTLLVSDQSLPRIIGFAVWSALLLIILWAPVLMHQGMAAPYTNSLSLKTRLGVGLYKLVFEAFGVAPILISLIVLFQARGTFQILPSFHKNLLHYWMVWLVGIFFALFFVYPTKIQVVLPGVACLIVLGAVHAGRRTWACFVLACLVLPLAHLDCFRNRQWTGLEFQPSLWEQSLAEKPAALGPETAAASRLALTGRHVVISPIWPWALAWQKTNAGWPGVPVPESKGDRSVVAYMIGPGIVASRFILDNGNPRLLRLYLQQGYDVWIDGDLYREMYMRYDLSAPTPETAVVEGIPCRVLQVK